VILVDTGPLVAAANSSDRNHERSLAALASAVGPRLVPGLVIAETCYLLARDAGARVEAAFLRAFSSGYFTVVDTSSDDLARAADLVEQYEDLPVGGTDAVVVALAERLHIETVATLDVRHFSVVRPRHCNAFTLVPSLAD
jgi:predicted nucleic acid-binding protein